MNRWQFKGLELWVLCLIALPVPSFGGQLTSVTLDLDRFGSVGLPDAVFTAATTGGASTANSGTWGGGNSLAQSLVWPTSPFGLTLTVGSANPLSVTVGGGVGGGTVFVDYCIAFTQMCFLPLEENPGSPGTSMTAAFAVTATLFRNPWSVGQVTATGLTTAGAALPDVVGTGSFNLDAAGAGQIQLVTARKIRIDASGIGDSLSTSGFVSRLTLNFVPEPSTLFLVSSASWLVCRRAQSLR